MRWTELQPHPLRSAALALFLLALTVGCERGAATPAKIEPASVERVDATGLHRLTLTERAIERTGIATVPLAEVGGAGRAVPYSAVIYGLHGETWVYTNPAPRLYLRAPIAIERIEGAVAHLSEGLHPDTVVVAVGAAELYGAETGVGK